MIESATIRNFQMHKKLTIDFDDGVTCIVGSSDAGKSSVLRAIWWVLTNRPTGEAFVRHGAKTAAVTLKIDGHTIIRRRGKSVNSYSLDGKEFTGFGTAVPEPIRQLLNIADSTFQNQHESAFWLSLSPPEVSRRLNTVVDLSTLDETLSGVGKALTAERAHFRASEKRASELQKEIDTLEHYKLLDKALIHVERLESKLTKERKSFIRLSKLVRQARDYATTSKRLGQAATEGRKVVASGERSIKYTNDLEEFERTVQSSQKRHQQSTQQTPNFESAQLLFIKHEKLNEKTNDLRLQLWEACILEKDATKLREELTVAQEELNKNMKGSCPICGKTL